MKYPSVRPISIRKEILASVAFDHLTKEILVEVLEKPSTEEETVNVIVEEEEENWTSPIIRCLKEGIWPEDPNDARALRMKINHYTIIDDVLFKKIIHRPDAKMRRTSPGQLCDPRGSQRGMRNALRSAIRCG